MLDAFTRVVAQADARGEYVSSAKLNALMTLVTDWECRVYILNCLISRRSEIVVYAARALFQEQPGLIAPGGNAYTNRRMAACLRDLEILLRYILYAFYLGDISVLQDRCLNGLRETYLALGVPSIALAVAVQKMKEKSIEVAIPCIPPGRDCSSSLAELASYFDCVLAALM
ncbi:MAG: phycocyanin subunit beta [Microcystis novacekii Mn_MB_F_20050700_S1]|uniref:Phycocyanin subunit beta n=1 Tax=Microcystis novacekii Mn_MB_F_20050700_S1D TaxID=2486266 RepID=A0A552IY82_9CHRO|nr:MAG: phycocyanin subunit beta [Microcystis novacekii Mn_MB_F_20050700_S1]TRU88442.1 MAG: phycocyanin subunit beta [Microcystis novacekii Mn_MB_F_20050700_S1D]